MSIDRTFAGHETRYTLRDGAVVRCLLVFDTGHDGSGPAVWKILLPDSLGAENLYGTDSGPEMDAGRLTAWLTPIVGSDAAAELAVAVDADPPQNAGWQRSAPG